MRHFEAPPVPDGFEEAMPEPAPPSPGKEITGPWSNFKEHLSRAQHGKCAYCEIPVTGFQYGEVDHYRPKSKICVLGDDPSTWGREVPNRSVVKGRRLKEVRATGYWWVAFSWDNYLLSCEACNQQWKKSLFPIEGARARPHETEPPEKPLLLNPFRGPDPCRHLHFRPDGTVEPWRESAYGLETIKTCGLDRPTLTQYRKKTAQEAFQLVKELSRARGASIGRKLKRFYEMGTSDSTHCPGMVQAIFRQETGIEWSDLERFVHARKNCG